MKGRDRRGNKSIKKGLRGKVQKRAGGQKFENKYNV